MTPTETWYPLNNDHSCPASLYPLVISILLSVSVNVLILGASYKWKWVICVLSCLLVWLSTAFTGVVTGSRTSSLLTAENGPLYVRVHPPTDTWLTPTFWLLSVMLLWTPVYEFVDPVSSLKF